MTAPVGRPMIDAAPLFIARSKAHTYTFDGVTYPGVTSVLKVLDKSGPLMAWAARLTAEAAVALADDLPHLIATVGPDGAQKALLARRDAKNEAARLLGTEVHDLAERIATGQELPAMSEDAMVRVDKYAQWLASSGWRIRAVEALLVNPTRGYGGTLDILAYDEAGRTVLADIKTGNIEYQGRVYDEIILQQAAYGMAEWLETGGALYAMPPVDRYAIIHVPAEGPVREVPLTIGQPEREAFVDALRLYRWVRRGKGE